MSTPQIITTIEQIEALDPDTLLIRHSEGKIPGVLPAGHLSKMGLYGSLGRIAVIATGEQVRAARKALEVEA